MTFNYVTVELSRLTKTEFYINSVLLLQQHKVAAAECQKNSAIGTEITEPQEIK